MRDLATQQMQVLRAIAEAATIEKVWELTVSALGSHGFERVNYGFTRYRVGIGIGDPDDAMFLSTHSLERVKAFHTSGLYLRTPEFRWVRENVGACSWRYLKEQRETGSLPDSEVDAMDEIGAQRARAGYTVSFAETLPRSKGAMGLAAKTGVSQDEVDAYWAHHEDEILALCNMAHLKLSQMPMPVGRARLTARQTEILEWIADGKTVQDISLIMGLSVSALEKHLRRAREVLSVETTAHAVAKASFFNQLFTASLSSAESRTSQN